MNQNNNTKEWNDIMKKNRMFKLIYPLIVSAIIISAGGIMPYTPEEIIDPPCIIRPNDEFLPDKIGR